MNSVFGTTVSRRYTLLNKLGEGGMGEVYRAFDSLTRQVVAFKRVRIGKDGERATTFAPTPDGDALRLALALEFHTLASLRHPNIISVLDYGFDEARQPFFTMDYLEDAQPLIQAGHSQPLQTRVNFLAQMLQAVAYLHRRGIIHRDLKPGNVLVSQGQVKVLDFGLSQETDKLEDAESQVAGTLGYVAPEVLRGEPSTEQADLYAIGVMAYELLAGHHPFDVANVGRLINDVLFTEPDFTPLYALKSGNGILDVEESTLDTAVHTNGHTDDPTTEMLLFEGETTQKYNLTPVDFNKIMQTPSKAFAPPVSLAEVVERLLAKHPSERYESAENVLSQLATLIDFAIPAESPAIRESYLQAARFVGRQAELNQLEGALARASDGQGSAWLVAGESGVGKSRLLDELRTRALVNGFLVLRGQAVAEGGMPFQLWREPLRRLALNTDLNDVDAGILKDIVPDMDLLQDRYIPEVAPVEGIAYQHRLFGTIANLFQKQSQPTLLLLEDLQWSRESLDVLKLLNGMVDDLPLLIVASYRDDERPDLPQILPGMNLLKLARLAGEHIAALSVSMLGEVGRQSHILNFLRQETEGNVYFVVEVVRALAEEAGSLDNIGRISLPLSVAAGGIQTVLRRRLNRVPESDMFLLQLAAVAGRELDLAVLDCLKGDLDLDAWLTTCANCAVLDVQDGEWRFSHDRLRTTTLDMISPDERPRLHQRVAEAIEAVYPNQPEKAIILAQHWGSAGNRTKERYYSQRTGEHALHVSAFDDAIQYFTRALDLLDNQPDSRPVRADLLLKLGEALKYTGSYEAAAEKIEQALEIRRALGEPEGIAVTLLELSDLVTYVGDYNRAKSLAEYSLSLYQNLNHQQGIARSLDRMGLVLFHQGEYAEAVRLCSDGLRLSREIGDQRGITSAINNLGMIAFAQGDYPAATRYFQETLEICRASGERRKAAAALLNLGSAAGEQNDYDAANHYFEESLAIFRSIGERRGTAMALDNLGVIAEFQADYPRAMRYYEDSLSLARVIGNRRGIATTLLNLGNVARAQGEAQEANTLYRQALQQAREIEAVPIMLEILIGLAALQTDSVRALEWLGLVLNHPSLFEGTRKVAAPVLDNLRNTFSEENIQAGLARGQALDLNTVVAEVLG